MKPVPHRLHDASERATAWRSSLAGLPPVAGTPHATVYLNALAALMPHLSPEDILAAWPQNAGAATWWRLLDNLGFDCTPPRTNGNEPQCRMLPSGDIQLSFDNSTVWQAASCTVSYHRQGLPSGHWVALHTSPEKAAVPATRNILFGSLRPVLSPLLISSILVQALGLLVPIFVMVVYDRIIDGRAPVGYASLLIGMLTALMAEGWLRRLRGMLLVRAGVRTETQWVNRLAGHLLHLPVALLERAPLGAQLNRLKGVEVFRDMATSPIVLGILDIPFVLGVLLILGFLAGPLVLVPLLLILAYLALMFSCLPWAKNLLRAQATAHDAQQALVLEAAQHGTALRADGLTEIWLDRLATSSRAAGATTTASTFLQHVLEVLSLLGSGLAGLLTLSTGIGLVQSGALSGGALVAAMMLVWRMLAPLSLVCTALPRLIQLTQTSFQLADFLQTDTETPARSPVPPPPLPTPAPRGELEFSGATLRYSRDHPAVLTNLSARIMPGQLALIMGANGSGSSSLLKVIMGLYPLQAGTLRLDGTDMRQWDIERLRRHLAYLPQQPDLDSGTLAGILRMTNPHASDDDLWQALEMADLGAAVRDMDKALDEPYTPHVPPEPMDYQLSLARLYLHPGSLVLCDQLPPAVLNSPAGQNFLKWIAAQRGRRTVVFASSHHSLLPVADIAIGLRHEQPALVGPAAVVASQLRGARHSPLKPVNPVPAHAA